MTYYRLTRLVLLTLVWVVMSVGLAFANVSCSGQVICPDKDIDSPGGCSPTMWSQVACPSGTNSCQTTCSNGCAPQAGSQCEAIAGACGPGLGTCPGTQVCLLTPEGKYACSVGSGGGGGGNSCPPECRQGSACGKHEGSDGGNLPKVMLEICNEGCTLVLYLSTYVLTRRQL